MGGLLSAYTSSHFWGWGWGGYLETDPPFLFLWFQRAWARHCHTEWSKSNRERQTSYDITYMWNLKKWYKWTYLQKQKQSLRCRPQTYGCQVGKGREGINEEIGIATYTLLCIKQISNRTYCSTGNLTQYSVMTYMGKKNLKKRGYMYTYSWFTLLYSRN